MGNEPESPDTCSCYLLFPGLTNSTYDVTMVKGAQKEFLYLNFEMAFGQVCGRRLKSSQFDIY